jgi:protein AFG1
MYEHKARFMCSAEALPIELFKKVVTRADARSMKRRDVRCNRGEDADLLVDNELGFAKDRTISRFVNYLLLQ